MMTRILLLVLFCATATTALSQQWRYTGSMHHERRHHITVLLPTGEVLVAGGTDNPQHALSSCEIYDPVMETWRQSTSMTIPRERHTATMLSNGELYVIAGNRGSTGRNELTGLIEKYSAVNDTWTPAGNLNIPRQNHTATLLQDGRILVTGGYTGYVSDVSCEIFDPSNGSSTIVAALNIGRHDHQAVALPDGKVLVAGGRGNRYENTCELYDPAVNSWTLIDDMEQARAIGSLALFNDGTVLTTGGRNSHEAIAPGAELLDLNTMTWETIEPLQQARHWQGATLLPNNRYLITGGYYGGDLSTNSVVDCTPICEWYDRPTKSWYFAPSLNLQRGQHGAVFFQSKKGDRVRDNVILTGGIYDDYKITPTCEILDVTEDWIQFFMANQPSSGVADDIKLEKNVWFYMRNGRPSLAVKFAGKLEVKGLSGATMLILNVDSESLVDLTSQNLPAGVYFARLITESGPSELCKFTIW